MLIIGHKHKQNFSIFCVILAAKLDVILTHF